MNNTQLVVLAAGKGTRMNSALPKVLVGFKGKPLIQHLLDNTKEFHSAKKPVIVVGHRYELVQGYLGANYIYAFQQGQLGTGHAVLSSKPQVDADNVLILYGDMPFIKASSVQSLLDLHEQKKSKFSMFVTNLPSFEKEFSSFLGFGRILRDRDNNILQIKEFVDATDEEKQIKEVNPGIYIFNAKWLWENLEKVPKNKHGEYYLTDLVEIAIKNKLSIETAEIDPLEVFGINTPEQLKIAEKLIM